MTTEPIQQQHTESRREPLPGALDDARACGCGYCNGVEHDFPDSDGTHAAGVDPECAVCAPEVILRSLEQQAARWRRAEHYLAAGETLGVVHRTSILFPADTADEDYAYYHRYRDGIGGAARIERATALKILGVAR